MPETAQTDPDAPRRAEVERLLGLALDMLDETREQIVHDYIAHARSALDQVRQTERADDAAALHNYSRSRRLNEPSSMRFASSA